MASLVRESPGTARARRLVLRALRAGIAGPGPQARGGVWSASEGRPAELAELRVLETGRSELSGYRDGGGDSRSQRSLPRSSGSPSPEAPAWRLEDCSVGTSGEQLQGQSGSRGARQARPGAGKA